VSASLEAASDKPADTPPWSARRTIIHAVTAASLFLSVYVAHYLGAPPGFRGTGFIQYDQPYYSANGREVFERGNGFAHPNPYDSDSAAPVIYWHWFTWLLGFGIKKLGCEPGIQYVIVGVIASIVCSYLTFRLVEHVLPDPRFRTLLYFLVMWGGGILCLGRLAENVINHRQAQMELFKHDPAQGWWFLNWGRNLVYPTEAVYHSIVAATWLGLLRARWRLALLGTALLAATHPFSGLQLLLMVFAWLTLLVLRGRSRDMLMRWATVAAMLVGFLGYYTIYLPSFEGHSLLQQRWLVDWPVPAVTMLLAYGPVALVAGARIWADRRRLDPRVYLFATCVVVSFLLLKHGWFINARQPVHFTRGYIWMPLCLIALPALQRLLLYARSKATLAALGGVIMVSVVTVSDNVIFVVEQWRRHDGVGWYLTKGERGMFSWMDQHGLDGVLLCPDLRVSYLSATFTSVRPYIGHDASTPLQESRLEDVELWLDGGYPPSMIDYVLVPREDDPPPLHPAQWELLSGNEELLLYQRKTKVEEPGKSSSNLITPRSCRWPSRPIRSRGAERGASAIRSTG
jgi:hypothetical protein